MPRCLCASLVAVDDCGEPVGDEDGGAAARGRVEGAHDAALRDRVQRGRHLVEHQNRSVLQSRPSYRELT